MENIFLKKMMTNNFIWAENKIQDDRNYFDNLSKDQKPKVLWIGCSDSRVSATEIVDVEPGEMFVHRNIANMVVHSDLNLLSVLEYAVKILKVQHVIVCGHYECGGVKVAMNDDSYGIIDNWIRNIKDVYKLNKIQLDSILNEQDRFDRFVELNVLNQVQNIKDTTIVKEALANNQELTIHGWVFNMRNGKIKNLF